MSETLKTKLINKLMTLVPSDGSMMESFQELKQTLEQTTDNDINRIFEKFDLENATFMDFTFVLLNNEDINIPEEATEESKKKSMLPTIEKTQSPFPQARSGSYNSTDVSNYTIKTDQQVANSSPIYLTVVHRYIKETKNLNKLTIGTRAVDAKAQQFLDICLEEGIIDDTTLECFINFGYTLALDLEQFYISLQRREENKPLGTARLRTYERLIGKVRINLRVLVILAAYCRVNISWSQISKNETIAKPFNEGVINLEEGQVQKWWNSRFVWETLSDENKSYFFEKYFWVNANKMANYLYSMGPVIKKGPANVEYIEFTNEKMANAFRVSYSNKFFIPRPKLMINLRNGAVPVLNSFILMSHEFVKKFNNKIFKKSPGNEKVTKLFLKHTKLYDNLTRLMNGALGRLYNFQRNQATRRFQENKEIPNIISNRYLKSLTDFIEADLVEAQISDDDRSVDIQSIKDTIGQSVVIGGKTQTKKLIDTSKSKIEEVGAIIQDDGSSSDEESGDKVMRDTSIDFTAEYFDDNGRFRGETDDIKDHEYIEVGNFKYVIRDKNNETVANMLANVKKFGKLDVDVSLWKGDDRFPDQMKLSAITAIDDVMCRTNGRKKRVVRLPEGWY